MNLILVLFTKQNFYMIDVILLYKSIFSLFNHFKLDQRLKSKEKVTNWENTYLTPININILSI